MADDPGRRRQPCRPDPASGDGIVRVGDHAQRVGVASCRAGALRAPRPRRRLSRRSPRPTSPAPVASTKRHAGASSPPCVSTQRRSASAVSPVADSTATRLSLEIGGGADRRRPPDHQDPGGRVARDVHARCGDEDERRIVLVRDRRSDDVAVSDVEPTRCHRGAHRSRVGDEPDLDVEAGAFEDAGLARVERQRRIVARDAPPLSSAARAVCRPHALACRRQARTPPISAVRRVGRNTMKVSPDILPSTDRAGDRLRGR